MDLEEEEEWEEGQEEGEEKGRRPAILSANASLHHEVSDPDISSTPSAMIGSTPNADGSEAGM